MICFPNAKLNIGLNITSKRNDGFHEIESIFYPLKKLNDVLEIIENKDSADVEFSSTGIAIPGPSFENICIKAYQLIKEKRNVPAIKILLHKLIPIGAGLGGGSADAAFFIQLINAKFNLQLSQTDMFEIASELGSDCPFFLVNKPCLATGRGEILTEINLDLSNYKVVLILPGIHISTAMAYAGVIPKKAENNLFETIQKPIIEWRNYIENDFEKSIFLAHPLLEKIKLQLYDAGAVYTSMSGSGSTMFGIFSKMYLVENLITEYKCLWYDL